MTQKKKKKKTKEEKESDIKYWVACVVLAQA